jgi:hypothetical protein
LAINVRLNISRAPFPPNCGFQGEGRKKCRVIHDAAFWREGGNGVRDQAPPPLPAAGLGLKAARKLAAM